VVMNQNTTEAESHDAPKRAWLSGFRKALFVFIAISLLIFLPLEFLREFSLKKGRVPLYCFLSVLDGAFPCGFLILLAYKARCLHEKTSPELRKFMDVLIMVVMALYITVLSLVSLPRAFLSIDTQGWLLVRVFLPLMALYTLVCLSLGLRAQRLARRKPHTSIGGDN